jgi:hypothetical protein
LADDLSIIDYMFAEVFTPGCLQLETKPVKSIASTGGPSPVENKFQTDLLEVEVPWRATDEFI